MNGTPHDLGRLRDAALAPASPIRDAAVDELFGYRPFDRAIPILIDAARSLTSGSSVRRQVIPRLGELEPSDGCALLTGFVCRAHEHELPAIVEALEQVREAGASLGPDSRDQLARVAVRPDRSAEVRHAFLLLLLLKLT